MGVGRNHTTVAELAGDVSVTGAKLVAAAVSGSSALFAATVQSVAGTGNDVLTDAAERRRSRQAWFWALFGAIGLFGMAAALAIWEGVHEVVNPSPMVSFALAYAVLAFAFVVEVATLVRTARSTRSREGRKRALLTDGAALVGTLGAAVGVALHHATGSVVPDAVASIAIGGLLAAVAGYLTGDNREFLAGERISPESRRRIAGYIADCPGVTEVREVMVTFTAPDEVWVVARIDIEDGLSGREVEDLVMDVERTLVQRSAAIGRVDVVPVGHDGYR